MMWVVLALAASADLVDVAKLDARFRIDVKYATTDNFTGKKLYPVGRCVLRREVASGAQKAQAHLDAQHPGYVLLFKDCYRPVHVQLIMWEVVKGTAMQSYVANPHSKTGSVHNYGAAVDLTLAGPDGSEVDMGTPYDHLGILSEPRHEERFVKEGKLTAAQVQNRRRLRDAMLAGGFKTIPNEWWHFDWLQGAELRARFEKLDVALDAVP
ncbi:MAG: M15 family metallopeptidase [Deltaproteobacteria bacterium]|nr:M15 family metallopeptidase [Deltaproteobacteria bacterium]